MGRHEISVETVVDAPAKRVWTHLAGLDDYPAWMSHVAKVVRRSKETPKVGSEFRLIARRGTHEVVSECEIIAFDAGVRLKWRHVHDTFDGKPLKMLTDAETEFLLSHAGKKTRVQAHLAFVAHGIAANLGASLFLNAKAKPEVEKALAKLKEIVEGPK